MENTNKKEILRRLDIIMGHLGKVAKMAEEDKYCIDILQQSLAVQNALKKVDSLILDQHLHQCVTEAIKSGSGKKEKSIQELLKVYQLSNK
jgi:CsoR family transcriptional regulator, copper-sensing transcriptional repressor